jgi:hypothetical protein
MTDKHEYSEVQRAIADAANIVRRHRSKTQNINVDGNFKLKAINSVVALGDICGKANNAINQIPDHANGVDFESIGLRDKLRYLEQAIESEPTLSNVDKAIALEQLKIIAEATHNPTDHAIKDAAKTAHMTLKGMAISLPSATKIVNGIDELTKALALILAS